MCDVWCVMCDVWCVMCDVWCVMCDVWCVMCVVWRVTCVVPRAMCYVWYVTYTSCQQDRASDSYHWQYRDMCDLWCVTCVIWTFWFMFQFSFGARSCGRYCCFSAAAVDASPDPFTPSKPMGHIHYCRLNIIQRMTLWLWWHTIITMIQCAIALISIYDFKRNLNWLVVQLTNNGIFYDF